MALVIGRERRSSERNGRSQFSVPRESKGLRHNFQKLEKDVERRDLLQSQVDRLEPHVRNFQARQQQELEVGYSTSSSFF